MSAVLALVDATLGYAGRHVLARASFEIPASRRVALLGRNGAGKSTLLRALAGIQRPLEGRVTCDGRDIEALGPTARGRRIAYLPQQVSPEIPFTVFEVVLMGRYPHRGLSLFSSASDRAIVSKVLDETALAPMADKKCNQLSGGEFQRVLVASILAQEAPIMLLDEPTASLDLHHRSSILSMTGEEGERTVVIATHDINLAAAHCGWVVVLDGRGGFTDGPTDEVLSESFVAETFGIQVRAVTVDLPSGRKRRQFVVVS
jgi:iron complex transport system ATP-binding protein